MKTNEPGESIYCPQFDPSQWDEKTFHWENKKFISDRVKTLFYIPLNFSQVMKRFDNTVREAGAEIPDWLCLSEHTSKWNMNLYLAVDRDIPGARNVSFTGNFFCKVYEGPYKDAAKWKHDYEQVVKERGLKTGKQYLWYTTCPKCVKKYGKNYSAIFSQVE